MYVYVYLLEVVYFLMKVVTSLCHNNRRQTSCAAHPFDGQLAIMKMNLLHWEGVLSAEQSLAQCARSRHSCRTAVALTETTQ